MTKYVAVFAVLCLAGVALAQQQQYGQDQMTQQPTAGAQRFIKEALQDQNFEIQAAQQVAQQAQDPQVKQFAQQLVQDHQQLKQQLQPIAQQMGIKHTDEPSKWQREMLDQTRQLQGRQLERDFVFDQVGLHQMDLLKTQYQATHSQDPQVRQAAQQAIPVLQRHLQLAQQLAARYTGGGMGMGMSQWGQGQVYGQAPYQQQGWQQGQYPQQYQQQSWQQPGQSQQGGWQANQPQSQYPQQQGMSQDWQTQQDQSGQQQQQQPSQAY